MRRRGAWLALVAGLVAGLPAPAQEGEPASHVPCRFCESRGEKPCKRHRGLLEAEREVEFCSEAAACRACHGALTVDCKICRNEPVERARAERIEKARVWLAGRRERVDAVTKGRGIVHVRSAHVDLAFSIRPLTVGRRKLSTHELAHLYVRRIEDLRRRFLETFGLGERDFSARLEIYMFADRRDHRLLAPRVAGGGGGGVGMKLMGASAVYCMYHERRSMPGDEELWRTVAHNVAHLLLGNMHPAVWIGNRGHGWVDAGVAHWFEDLLTGRCATFCYEEVGLSPGAGYRSGRWRVAVRKLAEARKLASFVEVSGRNTDQLSMPEHAQAFAYVDFLLTRCGGEKFAALVRRLKEKRPLREALPETCGLTVLGFDEAFRAWVRANYPLQERGR